MAALQISTFEKEAEKAGIAINEVLKIRENLIKFFINPLYFDKHLLP